MTEPQKTLPPVPSSSPSRSSFVTTILFALMLIVAAGGAWLAYQFWNLDKQFQQSTLKLSALENQNTSTLNKLGNAQQSLQLAHQALQNTVIKLDESVIYQNQQLLKLSGGNRADWLLSEVEYLLRLANQRLLLERDIAGSELILSAAEKVLAEVDDPSLLPARVKLAEELLSLQSLPTIDNGHAYAKLASLVSSVSQLPERNTFTDARTMPLSPNANQASEASSENFLTELGQELTKALRIRRTESQVQPLLPPEEKYYLSQNLRLMYEQASLALLDQNDALFQASLGKASDWLGEYYETKDTRVQAHQATVEELAKQKLALDLPDISGSLKLIKARIEALYRRHQLDKETSAGDKVEEDAAS